jgi:hypothetical protein
MTHDSGEVESVSLADAVSHLLEECRMVLPGVQALFGFQLIAVFSAGFEVQLNHFEQRLHLLALGLVAISGALVMTPAAYHRQTRPREASEHFLHLAGRLLVASMIPLMIGIGIDFFLIARVIIGSPVAAFGLTIGLELVFIALWFLLPQTGGKSRNAA